jgi:hypothetical protein
MSEQSTKTEEGEEEAVDRSHLDVEDGCGCAEVWEHLSAQRDAAAADTKTSE